MKHKNFTECIEVAADTIHLLSVAILFYVHWYVIFVLMFNFCNIIFFDYTPYVREFGAIDNLVMYVYKQFIISYHNYITAIFLILFIPGKYTRQRNLWTQRNEADFNM